MTQFIQHIMSKIGVSAAILFLAFLCVFAPQKEASALDFEFQMGLGYEASFMHDSVITSDADNEVSMVPGGILNLEFNFIISDWFAIALDIEGGAALAFPTFRVMVDLRFFYRNEYFEFAGKIGIGMGNLSLATNLGISLSYLIDENWSFGIALVYTPTYILDKQYGDSLVGIHSLGTTFNFGYRF